MKLDNIHRQSIHFTFCHRKPERSFFWKGKQFPVCSRCTGIYIGYLTFPIFTFNFYNLSLLFSTLIILPTIIDGLTQAYFNRESNNLLRFSTGLLAGIGSMSLVAIIGQYLGHKILELF